MKPSNEASPIATRSKAYSVCPWATSSLTLLSTESIPFLEPIEFV